MPTLHERVYESDIPELINMTNAQCISEEAFYRTQPGYRETVEKIINSDNNPETEDILYRIGAYDSVVADIQTLVEFCKDHVPCDVGKWDVLETLIWTKKAYTITHYEASPDQEHKCMFTGRSKNVIQGQFLEYVSPLLQRRSPMFTYGVEFGPILDAFILLGHFEAYLKYTAVDYYKSGKTEAKQSVLNDLFHAVNYASKFAYSFFHILYKKETDAGHNDVQYICNRFGQFGL